MIERLKIKTALLIMGSLAMIGSTLNSFCQLLIVTNICAINHEWFFLTFINRMSSISKEYLYLSRDKEMRDTLKRYEEVCLLGASGSVDVVHVKWSNCPVGILNRKKRKESYHHLHFSE